MIRQPAVAGSFYPADANQLTSDVQRLLQTDVEPHQAYGIIVPHAGYIYSGALAGEVISTVEIPEKVILLGPNHHGAGPALSVSNADEWLTPLGPIPVATELRNQLVRDIPQLSLDNQAHQYEHSLEVMLPFLLQRQAALEIIPIAVAWIGLEDCLNLGDALAREIKRLGDDILLLASTDMNHFKPADETERLDAMAIAAMTGYDPERLYQVVRDNRISMCGVLPAVVVMQAARKLGATSCQLIRHTHSGKVNGDYHNVVGYAGFTIQ
ncbi:MAG: AmmeMemoRadiSam system protein B [Desulfuromonas sp.]|nr:MAG: AmmeMemoRadiSam system protein B [Desulfuromonas sp.]